MKNLPGRIRGGFSRGRVAQWQVQGPPFAPPNRSFVRRHKSGGVMRHVLTEGHPMDSHRGVGRTQGWAALMDPLSIKDFWVSVINDLINDLFSRWL